MLRIRIFSGSDADDICDYCRKQTGEEVICLQFTGRAWRDREMIQIHTKCLVRQIKNHYSASDSTRLLEEIGRN